MRTFIAMLTTTTGVLAGALLLPAQASADSSPNRSETPCPSYACGSATATRWDTRGVQWTMSVSDNSCGAGSPTAVVKIRILLSNNSSVWTTPRPDTVCGDNYFKAYSEYFINSHLQVRGFWVRIDNGATVGPITQGDWVDNPLT